MLRLLFTNKSLLFIIVLMIFPGLLRSLGIIHTNRECEEKKNAPLTEKFISQHKFIFSDILNKNKYIESLNIIKIERINKLEYQSYIWSTNEDYLDSPIGLQRAPTESLAIKSTYWHIGVCYQEPYSYKKIKSRISCPILGVNKELLGSISAFLNVDNLTIEETQKLKFSIKSVAYEIEQILETSNK